MGSRFPSHQLSNGLYVSGRPGQPKEKPPTMSSVAMPYTGGDVKKSGELGKMFDIPTDNSRSRKSGPVTNASGKTGSFGGAAAYSGPAIPNSSNRSSQSPGRISVPGTGSSNRQKSNSGPLNKQSDSTKKLSGQQSGGTNLTASHNSGPLSLPTTGLITSGPVSSGPLNSSAAPRKVSGPLESSGSVKIHSTSTAYKQAVTTINKVDKFSSNAGLSIRNLCWGRRALTHFIASYPDAELRTAKDGQYIKVSGIVTCGSVPLESTFTRVPRCVYTSTSLYEYRGWNSKPANPQHRLFTWGLRATERHVVDFYISDFQSGLRALVKTGYGAKITTYVNESAVLNIDPGKKESSPEFLQWLAQRNLSSDDRVMRVKEGHIKEGSTVSVMGVVRRNANVLMIVPPHEPAYTGCQWTSCILPVSIDGIVLSCEDTSNDVIPV
ncbi:putative membrane protein At1g16860 isoform X1 [Curcuma longa]|uniref:putative membrane protein At1g16860 isoform X1 n=1 Tax=Curcuma longa TaxID=136217 RepID=UPI003D9E6481